MDVERRRRISRIYQEALARPAGERDRFLDASCGGDAALRFDVSSLLDSPLDAATREESEGARTHANPQPGLRAGATLGSYRIERMLGQGGMGAVYLAHDTKLHRAAAIKILPDDGQTSRARLLREARNAAALNHPNICTIYEVGEADASAFIAMEYVDGRSLSDQIAEAPLSPEQVAECGIQIADALEHAHGRQIVHRDLKSLNIVSTAEGRIKVLDFGLAKRLGGEPLAETIAIDRSRADLTAPGLIVGTIGYMAPEQLRPRRSPRRAGQSQGNHRVGLGRR